MKRRRGISIGTLGIVVFAVALLGSGSGYFSEPQMATSAGITATSDRSIPAMYSLQPASPADLRNPQAVAKAVQFLVAAQPTGTYILSVKGVPTVVPMDVAHASIALVSADRLQSAESAMTWLYGKIIQRDTPGAVDETGTDYSGSWYDAIQTDGAPVVDTSRGRGEGVGMALIATYSIFTQDPRYLSTRVGTHRVADLVKVAAEYLTRPSMQASDGRFYHSPVYKVSFNEECARMTLGLQLAGRMLHASGDEAGAQLASTGAARGLNALRSGDGMSQGMAYDFYAASIWGLATPVEARQENAWLKSTGLVRPGGISNWDWQLSHATNPVTWLQWWSQAQTVAPSETFDFAIASVSAGDVRTALDLEKRWVSLQRPDGGFDDGLVFGPFGLHIGIGQPTSYAVSRFILLEHLLTATAGRGA